MTDFGPDPIDLAVGSRVRRRRRQLGLTQTDLSQALGLSFQQIQKYEKGVNRISASALVMIAAKLTTSVAELLGETSDPFESIGRADLATAGAAELLDCYARIEEPRVRRTVLALATALAREADRRSRNSSNDAGKLI